jgi:hypothetical protein
VVSIFHNDAQEAGCTNGVVIADIVGERADEDLLDVELREVDNIMYL